MSPNSDTLSNFEFVEFLFICFKILMNLCLFRIYMKYLVLDIHQPTTRQSI